MKNAYILFFLLFTTIFSQVRLSDINRLSNAQLELIKSELQSKPATSGSNIDIKDLTPSTVAIKASEASSVSAYYGYDYFKKNINYFDNTPTPADFILGPGDEIVLSLWGEINSIENFTINKDGAIFYENIGFINIANKTILEVESQLVEQLSKIYSTLIDNDNPTKLKVELSRLKSLNVYFTGQIAKPGVNLIHPFSDIYSSIIQAGGIMDNGSLRNIKLIRAGKVLSTFDFYSFFMDGVDNFSNLRVLDGDIIHVPQIKKRVKVSGAVNNQSFYEIIDQESFEDLLKFAGGLSSEASSFAILNITTPISYRINDDNSNSKEVVSIDSLKQFFPNDGDSIFFPGIIKKDTDVVVFGRVKSPGKYPASSSLKEVLDLAGGFNDKEFRKSIFDDSITILRRDSSQQYSLEFNTSYEESDNFQLLPNDQIFVYSKNLYDSDFLVTVQGEVVKQGTFQIKKGDTIQDLINLAQGFTEIADQSSIILLERMPSLVNNEIIFNEMRIKNVNKNTVLSNNSIVKVIRQNNTVTVSGNVYLPGVFSFSKSSRSANNYLKLAGGMKPESLVNKAYIIRPNGSTRTLSKLGLRFVQLNAGDTLIIPKDENPNDLDITSFVSDLTSIITNLAAIIYIIDKD